MTGYKLVLPNNRHDDDDSSVVIKGVIFDMDGTLTKPQTWMFGEMRRQLAVPDGVDILTHLDSLPTLEQREEAELKLRKIEEKAMNEQEPTFGLLETFSKLHKLNVHTSICTRNVPTPVSKFCSKFLNCDPFDLHTVEDIKLVTGPVVTREFKPPKPSPKPLLHIIDTWKVQPNEVLMVGDSLDDMDAGLAAGCAVVLLRHDDNVYVENSYNRDQNDSRLDGVAYDLNQLYDILNTGLYVKPRN